jgi:hypothetical protein
LTICQRCRAPSRAIEERAEEYKARQTRANLRAEKAMRRAREKELYGSEGEDSGDEIPPSPTWSEIQMALVQGEVDCFDE